MIHSAKVYTAALLIALLPISAWGWTHGVSPALTPSIDLNFSTGVYSGDTLVDALSISNASGGTNLLPVLSSGQAAYSGPAYALFAPNTLRISAGMGLLIEGQSVNHIPYSTLDTTQTNVNMHYYDLGGGTGTIPSVTAAYAVAPDGTMSAARIQANKGAGTTTGDYSFFQVDMIDAPTETQSASYSVWLKASSGTQKTITWLADDSYVGGPRCFGIYGEVNLNISGWTQVTCLDPSVVTQSWPTTPVELVGGGYSTVNAADVLVWGMQLEENTVDGSPPFATSYIPTHGAQATRSADNISISGSLLAALKQSQGTIVIKTRQFHPAFAAALLGVGSVNVGLQFTADNKAQTGWGSGTLATPNTATLTGANKVGLRWNGSGRSIVLNGGTIAADSNVPNVISAANLGELSDGTLPADGVITEIAVYSSALSDAQFRAVTQ